MSDAKTYGYHLPPGKTAAVLNEKRYRPPAQCVSEAASRLRTDGKGQIDLVGARAVGLVSSIDGNSYVKSLTAPALRHVFSDWSACMAKAGYRFRDPNAAVDSIDQAAPITKAEKALAVADVTCKRQVRLVPRWAAIEAPLEIRAIANQSAELHAFKAKLTATLASAAQALHTEVPG